MTALDLDPVGIHRTLDVVVQWVLQIRQRKIFEKFGQIWQPIALFANFAISSQIRQILATSQSS